VLGGRHLVKFYEHNDQMAFATRSNVIEGRPGDRRVGFAHRPRYLVRSQRAGRAAGAVNSIAGGGTLLTFPARLAGLSPLGAADAAVVANATSTVALVPGSLAGAWGYRREMKRARRWPYLLVGPSLAGVVLGALLVRRLDPAYFAALVPWLLLTAALLFLAESFVPPKAAADSRQRRLSAGAVAGVLVFQLVVAVYGGKFGAGASIRMLSALAALRTGGRQTRPAK
jgi:uncharacterized protein